MYSNRGSCQTRMDLTNCFTDLSYIFAYSTLSWSDSKLKEQRLHETAYIKLYIYESLASSLLVYLSFSICTKPT